MRVHHPGGKYPKSASYQLLQRIYDMRIAIWNHKLQKLQDNGTPENKKANERSSGIDQRKQKADGGEGANMLENDDQSWFDFRQPWPQISRRKRRRRDKQQTSPCHH